MGFPSEEEGILRYSMRRRYVITEEPMTPRAGKVVSQENKIAVIKRQRPDILKDVIDLERGNEIVTLTIPVYNRMHGNGMSDEEIFEDISSIQEAIL